jgi:hypothetical protein
MNEGESLMQKILLFSLFMSFSVFGMEGDGERRYGQSTQELNAARAPQVNALDENANAKLGLIFGYTLVCKPIWSLIGVDSDLIPAASILLLGLYLDGKLEFITRFCRNLKPSW